MRLVFSQGYEGRDAKTHRARHRRHRLHRHTAPGRPSTEADWSDPEKLAPYPKSKFHAERVAWDFAATHPVELVTINPGWSSARSTASSKPPSWR
jgi:nucleoside-diphosphate-sugar epimerase